MSEDTKLDLAAIKARCAAATPGEWTTCLLGYHGCQPTIEEIVIYLRRCLQAGGRDFHMVLVEKPDGTADVAHVGNGPDSEANAEFVAHARTDVPALVAEVERLREERDDQASLVEVFEDEAKRLRSELAECYRITGADPDGDDDAMLATKAVDAVKRLRASADHEGEKSEEWEQCYRALEAEIVRLRAIEAEAKTYLANMDYCFTAENLTVEDEGHRDASESRLRALLAKGGAA